MAPPENRESTFLGKDKEDAGGEKGGRSRPAERERWHLYKKTPEEIYVEVSAGESHALSGILMASIFLPSPAGALWKCKGKKWPCSNNCYLYRRKALDLSKCEVPR